MGGGKALEFYAGYVIEKALSIVRDVGRRDGRIGPVSQKQACTGRGNQLKRSMSMKCPVCTAVDLVMSERQGVEIDYCPACRGIWLDRGELDKILERSSMMNDMPAEPRQQHAPGRYAAPEPFPHVEHHEHHGYGHRQHKKKHWLHELFD